MLLGAMRACCCRVSLSACLSVSRSVCLWNCAWVCSLLCAFYRAECPALIRLQVITLSEQVLALDLAGAVGDFVSLPIAFLFFSPSLPNCVSHVDCEQRHAHAHASARGGGGGEGTLVSAALPWQSFYLDSVFLALEHVRAPFYSACHPPYSALAAASGPRSGLVIKYAGYQCQWCQKSTRAAAKVARKMWAAR